GGGREREARGRKRAVGAAKCATAGGRAGPCRRRGRAAAGEGARVRGTSVRGCGRVVRDAGAPLGAGLSAAVRAARAYGDRRGAERRRDDRTGDGAATG